MNRHASSYREYMELGSKERREKGAYIHFPVQICDIQSTGQRIIVGDSQESLHWVRYRKAENALVVFCDDQTPRYMSCMCILDYNTVAVGDRFGTIAILRLPDRVSEDVQEDPTGLRSHWDRGHLNGASQKMDMVSVFYIGDQITSIQKTSMIPGANDCIVYTTIGGAIGILVPFMSKDETSFFENLELHMRSEFPPLCGRDHLTFRSYYHPCKNVIDGDLCEQYGLMEVMKQKAVAEELDKTASEISKKLEDIRTRFAF